MKLCISASGKDTGSLVDAAFGRAPYFLIIDTETGNMEVVENSAASTSQGAGIAAAQTVTDKGANAVLTGYVGPNVFNALHAADIRIFEGVAERTTVEEAIDRFKKNEYTATAAASAGLGRGRGSGRGMGRGRGRGQCRRQ